jgi:hypothetical protein
MRGYVTVGTASTNEAHVLLHTHMPELIIVCAIRAGQEESVVELRNMNSLDNIPIVLVAPELPDREWMKTWNVAGSLPYPMDLRKLLMNLRPWLRSQPLTTTTETFGSISRPLGLGNLAA